MNIADLLLFTVKSGASDLHLSSGTQPMVRKDGDMIKIKAPILVICGDQDPGTPPAMSREIHEHAPGSKLVMIPNAAHLSNLENPAAFTKAMQEFLAAH